jgi:hypothetical protein
MAEQAQLSRQTHRGSTRAFSMTYAATRRTCLLHRVATTAVCPAALSHVPVVGFGSLRVCCRWDRVLLQGQFAQAVGRLASLSPAGGAVQNP